MKNKKIVVTGGSGFIGSHIVEELESRDYDVIIYDNKPPNDYKHKADFVWGDIGHIRLLPEAYEIGAIFHCAGLLGTSVLFGSMEQAIKVNVLGSLNVFKYAIGDESDNRHIPVVIQPNLLGKWLNPYMLTKNEAERWGFMFLREFEMPYISIKPTDVYGARQSKEQGKASADFISRAIQDFDIPIYGDGTAWVNYIYVKDVARLMVNAMEKRAIGKVLPISHPDNDMGVEKFAELVIEYSGSKSKIIHSSMRRGQPFKCDRIPHDCSETWEYISPDTLMPLKEGLEKTIEWYRQGCSK